MRPVSYFPESMPLDEVLVALQRTRENLAVIVDEYGGAAGIITVEDLLEEVVGEIEDEHDVDEEVARVVNRARCRCRARAPIAEFNERFGAASFPRRMSMLPSAVWWSNGSAIFRKPGEQLKSRRVTITVTRSDARAVREVLLAPERAAARRMRKAPMTEKRIRKILERVAGGQGDRRPPR